MPIKIVGNQHAKRYGKNPQAFIAMVGCFTQINPEEANKIEGVSTVLGNEEKYNLFDIYRQFF